MQQGDKVKVTGGGYRGSVGIIEEINDGLAKVTVNSFGVPMTARIPLDQLEPEDGSAVAPSQTELVSSPVAVEEAVATVDLNPGETVQVTGGGYKGSLGIVEQVDGDLAKVKVESFGAPMSVRIPTSQLEKVDGQKS